MRHSLHSPGVLLWILAVLVFGATIVTLVRDMSDQSTEERNQQAQQSQREKRYSEAKKQIDRTKSSFENGDEEAAIRMLRSLEHSPQQDERIRNEAANLLELWEEGRQLKRQGQQEAEHENYVVARELLERAKRLRPHDSEIHETIRRVAIKANAADWIVTPLPMRPTGRSGVVIVRVTAPLAGSTTEAALTEIAISQLEAFQVSRWGIGFKPGFVRDKFDDAWSGDTCAELWESGVMAPPPDVMVLLDLSCGTPVATREIEGFRVEGTLRARVITDLGYVSPIVAVNEVSAEVHPGLAEAQVCKQLARQLQESQAIKLLLEQTRLQ